MKKIFLLLSFLILISAAYAQKRTTEAVVGMGYPDVLHVGINTSISKRSTLGFNVGRIPEAGLRSYQFTLEHRYNFAFSKRNSDRATWYFGERLTYFYEENSVVYWRTIYLTPSIGRHFNFSDVFGLNFDAGLFIRVWERTNNCGGMGCDDEGEFSFIAPTARLQLFYKF
jgi:hypothetical protein